MNKNPNKKEEKNENDIDNIEVVIGDDSVLNIEPTEENMKKLFDDMAATSSMEAEGEKGKAKLMDAIHVLV